MDKTEERGGGGDALTRYMAGRKEEWKVAGKRPYCKSGERVVLDEKKFVERGMKKPFPRISGTERQSTKKKGQHNLFIEKGSLQLWRRKRENEVDKGT
jgi:hypothetical protein